MNVLADESVDHAIVERLRNTGHDVIYVSELSPGLSDSDVLYQANLQWSLLLTGDKDFGEIVYRHGRSHGGVVLVRLFGISAELKANIVAAVFKERGAEMVGAFTVISAGMVRIRQAP